MSHFIEPLRTAIRFVIQTMVRFGEQNFPGSDISWLEIGLAVWVMFFMLKWVLPRLFDIER